jgi:hypothetical protein
MKLVGKASLIKIVKRASGVPTSAVSSGAEVLECDVFRSTEADWKWAERYFCERNMKMSRRLRLRRNALRPYCGKSIISACIGAGNSVFLIFIDRKAESAIFWEERRRQPSGRLVIRCGGAARQRRAAGTVTDR